jgi:hypothetical protein
VACKRSSSVRASSLLIQTSSRRFLAGTGLL